MRTFPSQQAPKSCEEKGAMLLLRLIGLYLIRTFMAFSPIFTIAVEPGWSEVLMVARPWDKDSPYAQKKSLFSCEII